MPDTPAQGPTVADAQARIEGLLSLDEEIPARDTPPKPKATDQTPAKAEDPEDPETPEEPAAEEPEEQSADSEEDDEEHPAPRGFKVKVAGQEIEVTEDELKSGYSRTADYTRKTTELAERRKALEAEDTQVKAERQKYSTRLTELDDALKALVPSEPDWAQLQKTVAPDVFTATLLDWQQTQKAREAIKAEQDKIQAANVADGRKAFQRYMEEQSAKVVELIPEWTDPEVAKTERGGLRAFAKAQGFTDEEINQVTDARTVALLRKAMAFDKAEKAKPTVKEKIAASIRASTPGDATPRRSASKIAQAKAKVAKSGAIEDAAAAIEHLL